MVIPPGPAARAGPRPLALAVLMVVIHAAYSAFYSGLRAALFLSAALVLAAGLFALVMARKPSRGPQSSGDQALCLAK